MPFDFAVAFVGLGAMGEPMAANLCRKGVDVVAVAHRKRAPIERLLGLGAREARTPSEAGRQAKLAILMLPTSRDVERVLFGADGFAHSMSAGSLVIDCGTSDPACTRSYASRLQEGGIRMIDAPVSGGVKGAEGGQLAYFVGGNARDIEQARPLLALMGTQFHVMGPSGAGHTAKLLNNLISLSTVALVAETLALGEAANLDGSALLAALRAGSANSSILASHGPRMIEGSYEPGFTVDLARKDLALALALASGHAVPAFLGAVAHQIYNRVAASGHGQRDVASVRACCVQ